MNVTHLVAYSFIPYQIFWLFNIVLLGLGLIANKKFCKSQKYRTVSQMEGIFVIRISSNHKHSHATKDGSVTPF